MTWMTPHTGPWTRSEAAHLARRTGIGRRPHEIDELAALDLPSAVNLLVDYDPVDGEYEAILASLPDDLSDLGRVKSPIDATSVAGAWLHRLVLGNRPLQEQLAMFLHDTLVSDFPKVATSVGIVSSFGNDGSVPGQPCSTGTLPPDPMRPFRITVRLLQDQINLFRSQGHRCYSDLIKAVTRDPAMLFYLDNALNTRTAPQENFSREVMELFTMGVGNYTENDVKEAARAFTGETVDRRCQNDFPYTNIFNEATHDTGTKTLLGTSFNLGAGDVDRAIDIIMERVSGAPISPAHSRLPAAAIHMSWKLITWFVHETIAIDHPAVEELAGVMWSTSVNGYRYDFRESLRVLLNSELFFDPAFRYAMHKTPIEFTTGALRSLGLVETGWTGILPRALVAMGMVPFQAPNVAGWDHGRSWVTSGSIVARHNYADRISTNQIMTDAVALGLIDSGIVTGFDDDAGLIEYFRNTLIHEPLRSDEISILTSFLDTLDAGSPNQQRYLRKVRGLAHLFLAMPRFSLK